MRHRHTSGQPSQGIGNVRGLGHCVLGPDLDLGPARSQASIRISVLPV
jgi:hypothetical protein